MIALNILLWMLVIIVGVIFLPIFIALLCAAGYVLFWILLFLFAISISICETVKLMFNKVKSIFVKDNNRDANNKS